MPAFLVSCAVFLLLALEAAAASAPPAARTALVIGNAKYEAAVGPLRNTVNDAKAVAKTLRALGFAVVEEHNVTRDELLEAVLTFRKTLAGAEVGLFYYAGHGLSVAGSNYLLPLKSGYRPEGADDVALRMLAETRLFNVDQVVADMKNAGARCNLIILDACRTTAVARSGRTRDGTSGGGLAEMKPPAGSLIAFATDAGQTALDGDGANGLYTEELLKHLCTPGLTIEQVFKRTRAGVLERSEGSQVPAEYSRLIGEDIYLAGQGAPTPVAVAESGVTAAVSAEMKREPVPEAPAPEPPPTLAEVTKLAANGQAQACVEGLLKLAGVRGAGDYAVAPLEELLEHIKDDLKGVTQSSPKVEAAMLACEAVTVALRECLPPDHAKKALLTAKAESRRGDCLMLFGRAEEALMAYNRALSLTPEDGYFLYNRGRAYQVLGAADKAEEDFKAASSKTHQPGARKLAVQALAELKP